MNLKIEIELNFVDNSYFLEEILVDISDILVERGYGNEKDDESFAKSFIRVKKKSDDEVILVVVPLNEEEEKDSE